MPLHAGTMTLGDFVMINALMIQLYMPLNFIGSVYREIKQGLIDVEEMFALLEVEADIRDRPGAVPLRPGKGEIVFDHVNFAYDPERPILRDLSFRVPSGHTVAIVGPSGAGKSTISRLLYRFYESGSGRILIDGQDIAQVTQKSLRAAIGMVPQDTVLFNDTVRYNIRYGRPEAQRRRCRGCRPPGADPRLRHVSAEGYDTMVGERGLKLSGGEKQRVAIARTILKIAAHPHSRRGDLGARFHDRARNPERAPASVAQPHHARHRASPDDRGRCRRDHRSRPGRIAERGTHDELLKERGLYAAMWNRQREADEARRRLADIEHEQDDLHATKSAEESDLMSRAVN